MDKRKVISGNSIPMISAREYTRISIDKIQFIEYKDRKLHVFTCEGEEHVFYGKIEDLSEYLVGHNFYRVMKRLVINLDQVESMTSKDVRFKTGVIYGIGKNNMAKLRKAFRNYILGYAPFGEILLKKDQLLAEENELEKKIKKDVDTNMDV